MNALEKIYSRVGSVPFRAAEIPFSKTEQGIIIGLKNNSFIKEVGRRECQDMADSS